MKKHGINEYLLRLAGENLLLDGETGRSDWNATINKVSYSSQDIEENTLFVCKGANFKSDYLDMAIEKGAIAYISERDYEKRIPCIRVKNALDALAVVSSLYFNDPDERIKLIGITGTKGKSTTAYYVKYIFDEYLLNEKEGEAGIISSIETYDGVVRKESHITTPESLDLYAHLNNGANSGLEFMVSEVSSQGLKYGRAYGLKIHTGVFLNISEDHISPIEHSDFEDYFSSKLRIFKLCNVACVNLASDFAERILEESKGAKKVMTFGFEEGADVYGYDVHKEGYDTVFRVRTQAFDQEFRLTMPGLFNVENALAAISVALANEIPVKYIFDGLKKARSSGRMEVYMSQDERKLVIVDYAHNKLSFEKLYETAKTEYPDRKIITVFGCPGAKAFVRRRDLGTLAGLHSHWTYLTAEDPGVEKVLDICNDIAQYVKLNSENLDIIEDREDAIRASIEKDFQKSVILLTGKGNETTQKIGKEYIPYPTDVECTLKYLAQYNERKPLQK